MTVWLHEHPRDRAPEFRLGRDGDVVIAEWIGIGTLRASANGERSEFVPAPDAASSEVARVVDGTATAFLRHLRGGMTLHASAAAFRVAEAWRAVAFLGASGIGKSTMVAHLCMPAPLEAALVSDDLLHVDLDARGAQVSPTSRVCRLLPDARRALGLSAPESEAGGKAAVPTSARCEGVTPLAAIVHLVDAVSIDRPSMDPPTLAPLRGMAAFRALSESLFRFVLDDPRVQARDFDRLAAIAAAVPIYELRRPRGFEHLAETRALLETLFARDPQ